MMTKMMKNKSKTRKPLFKLKKLKLQRLLKLRDKLLPRPLKSLLRLPKLLLGLQRLRLMLRPKLLRLMRNRLRLRRIEQQGRLKSIKKSQTTSRELSSRRNLLNSVTPKNSSRSRSASDYSRPKVKLRKLPSCKSNATRKTKSELTLSNLRKMQRISLSRKPRLSELKMPE
jgi:hypothetical protein